MINKINNYLRSYKRFRDMRKTLWLKTSELKTLQWEKFRILISHAYENVPFYRHSFDEAGIRPDDIKNYNDLYMIPILTKSQLKNNKRNMIAVNINLRSCVEYKTSGSTGNTLSGYNTKEDALYARGSYERVRNENGFRTLWDTLLILGSPYTIPNKTEWYQSLGIRRIEGINVFNPIEAQIETLKRIKPDALWGYPSSIRLLTNIISDRKIKGISPRLVFTASEVLDSETRNLINSTFNVKLFDVYGAWETGCMAWECCKHSGYHVNMDTVLIEFVDEEGKMVKARERGRVVVTTLHSVAMPIIRYEIGDFAIPTYKECPCGRGGYLLEAIEGRYDDFIKLRANRLISPPVFWSIMKSIPEVSQFQIVQEKVDEFVVYVVKTEEFSNIKLFEQIDKEFKNILGDNIFLNIEIVKNIPRAQSGKLRSVISKV